MEGYSVEEAATVLGVPKGRVWELLARGVLAGTPEEGGGMRVFLRGIPGTAGFPSTQGALPSPPPDTANGHSNGDGHEAGAEASPFRELLTEFRNLTERYGQALLALGEARGEVAGLRARVEVLETRVNLRLPGPGGWAVDWAQPAPAATEAPAEETTPQAPPREAALPPSNEPMAGPSVAPGATAEADVEEQMATESPLAPSVTIPGESGDQAAGTGAHEPAEGAPGETAARRPRPRRRGSRSAVSGIAEALARAQDPTVSGLPGGAEAQEALAALRREVAEAPAVEAETTDLLEAPAAVAASSPIASEEPVTADEGDLSQVAPHGQGSREPQEPDVEPEPIAEAAVGPEPAYSAEWNEPDWIAEEELDVAWQEPGAAPEVAERAVASPGLPTISDEPALPPAEPPAAVTTEPEPREEAPAMAAWPVPDEDDRAASEEGFAQPEVAGEEGAVAQPIAEVVPEPQPEPDPEPEPMPAPPVDMGVVELQEAFEPGTQTPASMEEQPPVSDATASDAYEEELMWLGDEFRPSTIAWQPLRDVDARAPQPQPADVPPPASPSVADADLERLARQRGWDEAELSAIRSLLGEQPHRQAEEARSSASVEAVAGAAEPDDASGWEQAPAAWVPPTPSAPSPIELPGAVELDEAIAALDAGAVPPAQWSKRADAPSSVDAAPPPTEPLGGGLPTGPERVSEVEQATTDAGDAPAQADHERTDTEREGPALEPSIEAPARPPVEDGGLPVETLRERLAPARQAGDDWLRGRRGPAANAYRRLRRLLPG